MGMAPVALLGYNFVSKKTQDFMIQCFLDQIPVGLVIAADPVQLPISPPAVRTKLRHRGLTHPAVIAERLGWEYVVLPHNAPEVGGIVRERGIDLGIVSGARILRRRTIEAFGIGVINFHPGLIPEARGLDAMLWSIYHDLPLAVTAHLIDQRVDCGRVLIRQPISILADDGLLDLSERLYEQQLEMLRPAYEHALGGGSVPVDPRSPSNTKMPPELELRVVKELLPAYVARRTTG
jgi:methionyl-tRNA formyltransferase